MPGRSKFESRLRDLKQIADLVRAQVRDRVRDQVRATFEEKSPALVNELKTMVRHPRALGILLEERSPWLSRQFLGVASNLIEPFLVGMGLKVERLGEDVVEVSMPGWWRNQGEGGFIHAGALSSLSEFTSRLFWEHHLDLRRSEMCVKRVELKLLARPAGEMKAVFRLSVAEREAALFQLRATGSVEITSLTSIYDARERLVAETDVVWFLERRLALEAGTNSES